MSESGKVCAPVRAVALFSGGLDSQLAVCVVRAQGVEVHGVTFKSVFFGPGQAVRAARGLDLPLTVLDFNATIIELIQRPKHGLGAGMNPCIDCHAAMIRQAGRWMESNGFQFIITGEVAGERPMSQGRRTLALVARESGYGQFVLRPLSARLLPETEPERRGWVDRSKLLAIEGRSRKPQVRLALEFGLRDYPQPAGGCLLTDPGYGARLRDLLAHEGPDMRLMALLRRGRHFRIGPVRLIVGRNESDNQALREAALASDTVLELADIAGPTALAVGLLDGGQTHIAAALCARYGDGPRDRPARVRIASNGAVSTIEVMPAAPEQAESLRIQAG